MSLKSVLDNIVRGLSRQERLSEELTRKIVNNPLNAGAASLQTIAAGAISVTRPHVVVLPESGTADNLDEINNFSDGKFILISTADVGDTITVRDESVSGGNIALRSVTSRVLSDPEDSLLLIYKESVGFWIQAGGTPAGGVPVAHASTHQHGGTDEVATATPAANAIVKAGADSKINNGWLDAELAAIAGLTSAADRLPYFTGLGTASLTTLSSYGRTLAALADAAALRASAGLEAGGAGDIWVEKAGDTMSGTLNMGSQLIINLATPVSAGDAVTKAYVDAIAEGLDIKASVRAATTANITLSGAQTIDGVSVIVGDRVLVKNQSTGANNGIYVAAAGAWSRATDANVSAEVTSGMFTFVTEGTVNGNTGWALTTDDPITLGTTALVFSQFSGATNIAAAIDNASETTTPADANKLALVVSSVLTWVSWANIKATIKTYFDTLYVALTGAQTIAGAKKFTDVPEVEMASATLTIDATTGSPRILLQEAGATKWRLFYDVTANAFSINDGSTNWFQLDDTTGVARFLATAIFNQIVKASGSSGLLLEDDGANGYIHLKDGGEVEVRRDSTGILLNLAPEFITESGTLFQTGFRRESDGSVRFTMVLNSATSAMMGAGVYGDSFRRYVVQADGKILWGDGTATRDTNLYRPSADVLATDDSFRVGAFFRFLEATATIASGAITITSSLMTVDTEAAAATDDLDQINGSAVDGTHLIIRTTNDARDIVLRHLGAGTGNIRCTGGANFTLTSRRQYAELIYFAADSVWIARHQAT